METVVDVDPRGPMVLPKERRERAGIGPDQRLAVLSRTQGRDLGCSTLPRADDLTEMIRRTYGPPLSTATREK